MRRGENITRRAAAAPAGSFGRQSEIMLTPDGQGLKIWLKHFSQRHFTHAPSMAKIAIGA
jgi:hypothetical protein